MYQWAGGLAGVEDVAKHGVVVDQDNSHYGCEYNSLEVVDHTLEYAS